MQRTPVSDAITITLFGDKQVKKLLKKLGDQSSRKALRSGVRAAVKFLKKSVKGEVAPKWKSIKKCIGSKVRVNKHFVLGKVGINFGKKKGKGYAPHAAILVLGTKDRHTASGRNTGRVLPNNFVERGLATGGIVAKAEMAKKIKVTIRKEARKR